MSLDNRINAFALRVAEEFKAAYAELAALEALIGSAPPPATVAPLGYVLDGDSLTDGYGVSPSYPSQLATITGLPITNLGVSGRRLSEMDSSWTSRNVAALYNASGRNTLVVLGGANDLIHNSVLTAENLQAWMTSYVGKAKAAGFRVLVGTIPPANDYTGGRETLRTGFNAWIRSNASALGYTVADFAAIPSLANTFNATYYTDGLHLTAAGYGLLAEAVRVASGAAMVAVEPPPAGTLPADIAILWDANGYSGPTRSGSTPPVVNGALRFTGGTDRQITMSIPSGFYMCWRVRISGTPGGAWISAFYTPQYEITHTESNGLISFRAIGFNLPDMTTNATTEWVTLEASIFSGQHRVWRNGVLVIDQAAGPFGAQSNPYLFSWGGASSNYDVSGVLMTLSPPTDAERAACRARVGA